ncbi:hypothetical protein Cgig2_010646 [Carnegiea gigantea]|uniref:Uncharacterized protein n=1 Tax=Carnegiea gigantea TaxID=171969 RepID=A0A9Q1JRP6_9CARY|nr:hypothetical protein Cgig2_010646 [Carnegiea gigantea]
MVVVEFCGAKFVCLSGGEEEECWGLSSGSDHVPDDVSGDCDSNVSLAEEGDVDLHSGEEIESSRKQSDERKGVPIEGKGRYKRGWGYDWGGVGVFVGPDPILRGRVTLDIVVDFVSRLRPVYVEAIKGMVLTPILQYHSFSLQRELTLALVRQWEEGV